MRRLAKALVVVLSIATIPEAAAVPSQRKRKSCRLQERNCSVSHEFDCAARFLAYQVALSNLPWSISAKDSVYDALRLEECDPETGRDDSELVSVANFTRSSRRRLLFDSNGDHDCDEGLEDSDDDINSCLFVDPIKGNDLDNDGTKTYPLKTIYAARNEARRRSHHSGLPSTVILRQGRYHLVDTLTLDARDNGLTIRPFKEERPIISGGDHLKLTLSPTDHNPRIFRTQLPVAHTPFNFTLLFLIRDFDGQQDDDSVESSGLRLVWAREPNGHPERDLQPEGYARISGRGTAAPATWPDQTGAIHLAVTTPSRNSTFFPFFGLDLDPRNGTGNWLHFGGTGNRFVHGQSFWNGTVPTSMRYKAANQSTDNSQCHKGDQSKHHGECGAFLNASLWTARGYANSVAHVFHNAFWGNWQFRIGSVDSIKHQIDFDSSGIGYGGWQEGRGGGFKNQPFFVEGVFEALDAPGEWWLDRGNQVLFYYPHGNETEATNSDSPKNEPNVLILDFVAPRLKRLIAVSGTSEHFSAKNITLQGLTFAHSAATYMDPYEVPSPGDWSIRRDAVLFVENARHLKVDHCRFVRTGGNAIFLSGHVKHSRITRNEFAWTGDSAVATVGRLAMADGFTVDSFPADTLIGNNHFREIGIHGKQTSALFSALSCRTSFVFNVGYNGPRAGVNLNDQFCHGHRLEGNLLFNWVRETQDHGPINTWNRAMYVQKDPNTGEPTVTPQWTHVVRNFIMNGPSGNRDLGNLFPTIDNDDGSSFYYMADNFLVYGGAKNYLGNDKVWSHNLIAYPGRWSGDPCAMLWAGKHHEFVGNTCIVGRDENVLGLDATTTGFHCSIDWNDTANLDFLGRTGNNTYYLDTGQKWGFGCGNGTASNHWFGWDEMKDHGWELDSSIQDANLLTPKDIIGMAKKMMQLPFST